MAQWRIELTTQDLVALDRRLEITVSAIDEDPDASEDQIDVTISLLEV